jgi:pimeloyl-ACP methyl ester carboxylesterase
VNEISLTDAGAAPSQPLKSPTAPYASPSPTSLASQMEEWHHGLVPVADGVRLHYVVTGEGEPVVLLPGWPQSWYAWRFMIPLLVAAGRRVYAVDPRGFGDSDMPSDGYDLDTVAHDIHVFIEQLELGGDDGVDIVSHDTGSWIAHAHAAAFPGDVRRLVLSDAYIPGVSPPPPAGYPDTALNARQWHFYFNRVEGLPEALIHGRER